MSAPSDPKSSSTTANMSQDSLVESSLFRLTKGLPKRELNLMVQEAADCEALLKEDIRILEQALKEEASSEADILLESPFTPLDRYWTVSALLGRLRDDMALPSLHSAQTGVSLVSPPIPQPSESDKILNNLNTNHSKEGTKDPLALAYTQIIPAATLLTVFKKIMSNRAANVFKKPVKNEEAPGYADRIAFPMDLSMIRKRIVANNIRTYSDMHEAIALISHNCVKYNGRESDYGRVARDFEAVGTNLILTAVQQQATIAAAATAAAAVAARPAAGGAAASTAIAAKAAPTTTTTSQPVKSGAAAPS